jgi:hypothetical protein
LGYRSRDTRGQPPRHDGVGSWESTNTLNVSNNDVFTLQIPDLQTVPALEWQGEAKEGTTQRFLRPRLVRAL